MNKILLLICVVFSEILCAQTNDYKVTYKRFEGNLKRDAVLYVKENQPSVMKDIVASTTPIKVIKDTTYINENGGRVTQSFGGSTDYSKFPDEYIKVDQATHKIEMLKEVLKKKFLITDEVTYSWQITKETKQIQNYTCYKAITSFRGNTFEAWFTPDIPINAGPWKWYGLPGLIIEATDKDKSVVYMLEKVEKLTDDAPFPSSNSKKMNLRTYIKKANEASEAMFASNDRNLILESVETKRVGLERVYEWEEEPKY